MANALMPEEFFETVAPHHPPEQPVGPKGGRPRVGHRVIWFVLAAAAAGRTSRRNWAAPAGPHAAAAGLGGGRHLGPPPC